MASVSLTGWRRQILALAGLTTAMTTLVAGLDRLGLRPVTIAEYQDLVDLTERMYANDLRQDVRDWTAILKEAQASGSANMIERAEGELARLAEELAGLRTGKDEE